MADENFGQIVAACTDILVPNGDIPTERIVKRVINLCHSDICGLFKWTWLQRKATLTLPVNTSDIALPDGSSVLDINAAVPAYCRQVLAVSSVGEGQPLTPQPLILYELKNGRLSGSSGVAAFWAQYNRRLYAMPITAVADQLEVFYIAGHTTMVANADEPLIPGPYRNTLMWKALAVASALDTFDRTITGMANRAYEEAMMGLRSNSEVMSPAYINVFNVTGMVC